ncbi:MAG: NUDIX hydrolase [bacterium]|nr:NUDIX hydrolase [bacterium]
MIKPWHIKNTKYVLQDRWIKVRADECTTSTGITISPYYVLEYPNWVHMVVVDAKSKVLVNKQYRHGAGKICQEIPCGTIEMEDKTPLNAAKRELLEETGYEGDFELVGVTSPNPANHSNSIYVFLVTNPILKAPVKVDPTEVIICEFLELENIFNLIEKGEFLQGLHIGSLALAMRKLGRRF